MSDKVENKNCDQPVLDVKFEFIEESITSPYIDLFSGQVEGLVRGQPGDFVLPPEYSRRANEIYKFEIRKDDVWIRSFPKSGVSLIDFVPHKIQKHSKIYFLIRNELDGRIGVVNRQQLRH